MKRYKDYLQPETNEGKLDHLLRSGSGLGAATGSAVLCDMIGCREHATGEVQIGDEYIPLCEIHRKAEMDRLTPRWRPLPPHPPNAEMRDAMGEKKL